MGEPARRLAAVWAADIQDFDALSARDTGAALRARDAFRTALHDVAAAAGGTVHRDGVSGSLVEFTSAAAAVQAAVALLARCDARVGVHLGEVIAPGPGELLGDGVTVAQRLLDEATTGQVLISADVQRQLRGHREFYFQPMGERLLRGLPEPVETFAARLRRDGDRDVVSASDRFGAWLRSRRTRVMFYTLGVYVATVWTAVEVAAFVEARYQLTPNVTEVVLASLLLLLPSVLLVAYYHADPGRQRMPLQKKVGIPANLIAASIIVLLMFGSEDIGAVMETVAITDETGATIERQVPRAEHRKRFTVYAFDVEGDDAWLAYGLPYALLAKLGQDPFMVAEWPGTFRPRLLQTPYPDGIGMPLALQRELTVERHVPHFVRGSVRSTGNGLEATLQVYDAARGRAVVEQAFTARDVFALSDQMADALKAALGVPEWHVRQLADLPTAEVATNSTAAMREYTLAVNALTFDNDYARALEHLQKATARDPSFTLAYFAIGSVHIFSSRVQDAARAFAAAMEHLYRVPERMQILLRHNYYYTHGDIERAFAVVDMGVELYPDDIMIVAIKAQLDAVRGRRESAVAMMKRMLELDPAQHQLLHSIAQMTESLGRPDEAYEYYLEYTRRFPEGHDGYLALADFLQRQGRHDEAADAVRRAALLEPDNVQITTRLALLERNRGDFDATERLLAEALAAARGPADRAAALHAQHGYSSFRGRVARALEEQNAEIAESEQFQPPLNVLFERMSALGTYVYAGRADDARTLVESYAASLQPPYDAFAAVGRVNIAVALEDADAIEAVLPQLEYMIESLSVQYARSTLAFATGRMHELRGEYEPAIAAYEQERELSPTDADVPRQIARCLHALGRHKEAEAMIREALKLSPMHPQNHHVLALVLRDTGRVEDARRHLETALRVYDAADPTYAPARRVRDAYAAL